MSQIVERRRIHTLSFAIAIKDGYSKQMIKESMRILLNGLDFHPIVNPDFYYTFLNMPAGTYTVRVLHESKKYFDEELKIHLPVATVKDKLFEISLLPSPYHYIFPQGETLLSGTLRQMDGPPISGATLNGSVSAGAFSGKTDELGRFVIYFGVLAYKDIVTWKDKSYVNGSQDPKLSSRKINISIAYSIDGGHPISVREVVSDIEVGVNNIRNLELTTGITGAGIQKNVLNNEAILLKREILSMELSFCNEEGFPKFL